MVVYFRSLELLLGEDMGKITPAKLASDYEYFPLKITTHPRVWAGKARSRVSESWLGGLRRITPNPGGEMSRSIGWGGKLCQWHVCHSKLSQREGSPQFNPPVRCAISVPY